VSVPVGFDAVSPDDLSPALRDRIVVLSSGITTRFFVYIFTLEDETTLLSRNVGRPSHGAASPYSRGTETSTAPPRKSQDSEL